MHNSAAEIRIIRCFKIYMLCGSKFFTFHYSLFPNNVLQMMDFL